MATVTEFATSLRERFAGAEVSVAEPREKPCEDTPVSHSSLP